jgi:hypothetical protein
VRVAVRNEVVRLSLQDDFTSGVARATAAAAALNHELNSLSGQSVTTARAQQNISRDNDSIAKSANKADSSINKLTGRLRLLADVAAILGPSLVPIGALGLPAIAGLANQFGAAALAGGTAILAFQGVGTALSALNKATLEPTSANLEAARLAMEKLGPAAQQAVLQLQELRPAFDELRSTAAAGLFPGVIEGIDVLQSRLPDLERIIGSISTETGRIFADSAESLASGRWNDFLDFLGTEVPQTLSSVSRATGHVVHGLSELWMAFDPLNDDFSGWIEDIAQSFDHWAKGLDETQGFADFMSYVRTTGPQVADTFQALGDAVLQVVEAAAPLGGPTLQALEAIAKVVASIADSDLGTPLLGLLSAMALLNRAQKTYAGLVETSWGKTAKANIVGMNGALRSMTTEQQRATMSAAQLQQSWNQRTSAVRSGAATIAKGAAGIAALTLASTGASDSLGLSNTALLGMMGLIAGPWGAAVGAGVGLTMDMAAANNDVADAVDRASSALHDQPDAFEANAKMISDAIAQFDEFRTKVEGTGDFWADFGRGLNPASWGNAFEEIFGTSEVDEQRAALEELEATYERQKTAVSDLANEVRGNDVWVDYTKNLTDLEKVAGQLQPALDHFGISIEDLGNADPRLFQIYVDSIKDYIRETESVPGRTQDVGAAISALDDDLVSTADSADQLSAALKALLDPTINAEEATDQWRVALSEMRAEMEKNRKTFEGYSKAAIENRELTRGVLEDTLTMLTARAEDGASAGQIARGVLQARDAFIQEGVAAGFSAKQMKQRANELGLTPKLVKTVFDAVGIDLFDAKISGVVNQIEKLPKEVQVKLANEGFDLTNSQIQDLRKQYDLTPEQVETIIRASRWTTVTDLTITDVGDAWVHSTRPGLNLGSAAWVQVKSGERRGSCGRR